MSVGNVLFFSAYHNKIDKKGRISVPSNFRDVILKKDNSSAIVIYKSLTKNALEGTTIDYINNMHNAISNFDPFSKEKDAFTTAIFADTIYLDIDQEGRINIPKSYLSYAKIEEQAVFVGKGATFEIWNEELFAQYSEECRKFAIENAKMIKWS